MHATVQIMKQLTKGLHSQHKINVASIFQRNLKQVIIYSQPKNEFAYVSVWAGLISDNAFCFYGCSALYILVKFSAL